MANKSFEAVKQDFERGDAGFVDALRACDDADWLGAFAAEWRADPRPIAREFLFDYLSRPLNAYRHEALVKRLFKRAEADGDDAVMARFLVCFDRSVRRVKKRRAVRRERRLMDDPGRAEALVAQWSAEGAERANVFDQGGRYRLDAMWRKGGRRWENAWADTEAEAQAIAAGWLRDGSTQPTIRDLGGRYVATAKWSAERARVAPYSEMPRGGKRSAVNPRTGETIEYTLPLPPPEYRALLRLFSVHTRNYLRRRAWRYFRKLGKENRERYTAAAATALKLYTDADVADGLALLDNWGLVHILFHHSPVLAAKANGWRPAAGRRLADVVPAPIFPELWKQAPRAVLEVFKEAKARPVRVWAAKLVQQEPQAFLAHLSLDDLLALVADQEEEVAALAADLLRHAPGFDKLSVEQWLKLLGTPSPAAMEVLCDLMAKHVNPKQLTFAQAVGLATARPLPVAKLGLSLLQERHPADEAEWTLLLGIVDAQCEALRPTLAYWAWTRLSSAPFFHPEWVLEFLDRRHADVRAEGWTWLQNDVRARDDVEIWKRLLESPYDDVRLRLVAELERRVEGKRVGEALPLDVELVRYLWASVLLNIHRGGRTKPVVVGQLVRRLGRNPEEADRLLPILAAALRSVRGPEWRAGLAGIVQLATRNPELAPRVAEAFPELRLTETVTA